MKTKRISLCVSILLAASPTILTGQEPTTLNPGTRVKVSPSDTASHFLVGPIVSIGGGMLVVDTKTDGPQGGPVPVEIPLASIGSIEVSRGMRSHGGTGAVVGLLLGAVGGALWGSATGEETCPENGWLPCFEKGEMAVFGAITLGGLGAGLGWLVGHAIRSERWETIPLDNIRVGVAANPDAGVAFAASVRF